MILPRDLQQHDYLLIGVERLLCRAGAVGGGGLGGGTRPRRGCKKTEHNVDMR